MKRAGWYIGLGLLLIGARSPAGAQDGRLQVTMETGEAEAVLAILELRAEGKTPGVDDWNRLFDSEGYRRMKEREASLGVPITDDEFREFVMGDELLARAGPLRATLDAWAAVDVTGAAEKAFAYLPDSASIRATVYPMIKWRPNSYVWELSTDPAIFLYVDPAVSAAKLENTVAHELHHVGFNDACSDMTEAVPERLRPAVSWMGAFGEGWAMLAAAGGPDVHPHAVSLAAERAVWDANVEKVGANLERMERFFLDLIHDPEQEEITQRGRRLINEDGAPQGGFYTVGWRMAVTIERELGHDRLMATLCDPVGLVVAYNEAARMVNGRGKEPLPTWSDRLIEALSAR